MSIALTDDHKALADTASELLAKRDARGANRALLEAADEPKPAFWDEVAGLGWLGLHVPEDHGGSGFGLPELVVVVEELGRAVAPGPFVPTVIASAVIAAAAPEDVQKRVLPGLADGSVVGAVAVGGDVAVSGGQASGTAVVVGGGLADLLLRRASVTTSRWSRPRADGVSVEVPANLDQGRRSARVTLDGAAVRGPARRRPGPGRPRPPAVRRRVRRRGPGVHRAGRRLRQGAGAVRPPDRHVPGGQAPLRQHAGGHRAVDRPGVGRRPGRRAAGGDEFSAAAAMAATVALPAADECANLNIQVHGGIGFTWEHDAHLYLRRATAIAAVLDAEQRRRGRRRPDPSRREGRPGTSSCRPRPSPSGTRSGPSPTASRACPPRTSATEMIETGYVQPHWPKPWGRDAAPVEQLVVEQEFAAAGVKRPAYGITGWVILTMIQHGTEDQVARWVRPTLNQEVIWCQLFSEPDAGSDAAGVKTKATRVDGGWLVNGQKVWTSGAHVRVVGPGHRAHQPRRAQARRHHHDGDRHARPRASRCGRCA